MPGGLLSHLTSAPPHYVDLGGVQATSLLAFGASEEFWSHVTKLYASNCGLQTINGISALTNCRYLYLDGNALPKKELLRLAEMLPATGIIALDISNNPGLVEEVETALLNCPAVRLCEFFNGKRIRPT